MGLAFVPTPGGRRQAPITSASITLRLAPLADWAAGHIWDSNIGSRSAAPIADHSSVHRIAKGLPHETAKRRSSDHHHADQGPGSGQGWWPGSGGHHARAD